VRLDRVDMANVAMLEELLATAVAGVLVIVECTKVRWDSMFRLCPILLLTLKALFATTVLFAIAPVVGEEGLALVATFIVGSGNGDGNEDSCSVSWTCPKSTKQKFRAEENVRFSH